MLQYVRTARRTTAQGLRMLQLCYIFLERLDVLCKKWYFNENKNIFIHRKTDNKRSVMKYSSQPGILYDTVLACSRAAGKDNWEKTPLPEYAREKEGIPDLLDVLRKLEIPSAAAPFFREYGGGPSPAEVYLLSRPFLSELIPGAENLTSRLRDPGEQIKLRNCLTDALFGTTGTETAEKENCLPDGVTAGEAERIDRSCLSSEQRYQTLLCLARFSEAASAFCRVLERAEPLAVSLHGLYRKEIGDLCAAMESGRYDALYRETAGFEPGHVRAYSVTLLAAESVRLIGTGEVLLCGPVHPDVLLERFEEDHIDVGRFFDDMGSEPRRKILESLDRNGDGTASELSRETGLPVTTVLRHLETLSNDLLIMETRRSGLKIYYGLNRRFLVRAAKKTSSYLSAFGKDVR